MTRATGALVLLWLLIAGVAAEAAQKVAVRVGEHAGFSRLVFDWNGEVRSTLTEAPGRAVLRFDRPAELDLSRYRADPPPWILGLESAAGAGSLTVTVTVPMGARVRRFDAEGKVVLDVYAPSAGRDSPAAETPAAETPAAEMPAPIRLLPPAPVAVDGPEAARSAIAPSATEGKTPSDATASPSAADPAENARSKDVAARSTIAESKSSASTPVKTGPVAKAGARGATSPGNGPATRRAALAAMPRASGPGAAFVPALGVIAQGPLTLRLPWPEETAAAAFRRNSNVWLVFDRPPPAGLAASLRAMAGEAARIRLLEVPGATVIRVEASALLEPHLERAGQGWIVSLRAEPEDRVAEIYPEIVAGDGPAEIQFHLGRGGRIVSFTDPDLKDRLAVVPVLMPGRGLGRTREYPQFRALESAQGLVLQPFTETLEVVRESDVVRVRDADGLIVSHGGSLALLKSNQPTARVGPRLFDLARWRGDAADFQATKHQLLSALARSGPAEVNDARLALARFYFAHGLSTEALGLLHLRQTDDPRLARDPEARLMTGVGAFLAQDFPAATEHILHPVLAGESESALWRAALAASGLKWGLAARGFADTATLIAAYPRPLRTRLRLLAAEARLATGDSAGAEQELERIANERPNQLERPQLAFLMGRRAYLAGDSEAAQRIWEDVAAGAHAASRARARLALVDLRLLHRTIDEVQAIEELERLRFAWRGDQFEHALLERLGELYLNRGAYRKGLVALRQAAARFPESEAAQTAVQRMRKVFAELYLGEAGQRLPPLEALALFEEFKELTPAGSDGDRIFNRLAERLIEVDLLDRAADILDTQMRFRLQGLDKAQTGRRLAAVQLANKEPAQALRALRESTVADLPPELMSARRRLEARALFELGRGAEALKTLGADDSAEALRLRADFHWRNRDWPAAALVLQRLVPEAPAVERALTKDEQDLVLDLAVALTMTGQGDELARLSATYGPVMKGTPRGSAFALLVTDLDPGTLGPVERELAEAAQIEAFLKDYHSRRDKILTE